MKRHINYNKKEKKKKKKEKSSEHSFWNSILLDHTSDQALWSLIVIAKRVRKKKTVRGILVNCNQQLLTEINMNLGWNYKKFRIQEKKV